MLFTNFSSGELSTSLYGRVDLPQYYSGASQIINFDIIPTGGIRRRVGTKRCGQLDGMCRLIPFIIDRNVNFILEFGSSYIRFWKNGEKVLDASNKQLEFTSSGTGIPLYASIEEAREVQYAQNYDTMIFTHKNYAPIRLVWNGADSFTLSKISFDFKPEVSIRDKHGHYVPEPLIFDTQTFQASGYYPACCTFFAGRLFFASSIRYPQRIWASCAPDDKDNRYERFAYFKRVITVTRTLKNPDIHIFTADIVSGSRRFTNVSQDLRNALLNGKNAQDYYVSGQGIPIGCKVVSIEQNEITISMNADVAVTRGVFSIQLWQHPTNTSAADYEMVAEKNDVTLASSAFFFDIASDKNDAIKFLAQNKHLVVGTESAEWIIPSGISALNLQAYLNTRYGSDDIQGTCISSAVVFFASGKKAVREYYLDENDTFKSNDLALLNNEILSQSAACDFDYSINPIRLIVTRDDGTLALMLYEKNNNIMAWHRYVLGHEGKVVSTAVVESTEGNDIVYVAVKRGAIYYLEAFDMSEKVYIDSHRLYNNDASSYDDNAILYNATQHTIATKSDIPADFISPGDTVYIGYEYESLFKSLPVVNANDKKRIGALQLRFLNSFFPDIYAQSEQPEIISEKEPYSGIKDVRFPGSSDRDVFFSLRIQKPERCTILAINALTD